MNPLLVGVLVGIGIILTLALVRLVVLPPTEQQIRRREEQQNCTHYATHIQTEQDGQWSKVCNTCDSIIEKSN